MKPIAVLGCGPAGLMAAQAVALAGRELAILSKPTKSVLGGAMFLHQPIPGINDLQPDTEITYRVRGDGQTYQEKVYGEEYVPFTSFVNVQDGQTQQAWNLGSTYDMLWTKFGHAINDANIGPQWLDDRIDDFDLIMSTIPLPMLCRVRAGIDQGHHSFKVQDIAVATEQYGKWPWGDDTIVYDGTRDYTWYRASKLFGVYGTEWSDIGPIPPVPTVRDRKPITTNCDCYQGKVVRLGRRGTWCKGVLTHDAFLGAMEVLV